jgi:DNA-binding LytR/AlgR family response regulator
VTSQPNAGGPAGPVRGGLAVLAVDDEPHALEDLAYLLQRQAGVGPVTTAGDATEALRLLRDADVDVAFLDIAMPGLTGMDLARVLRRFDRPPRIVFVTAYDSYAVEAFDVDAVDYLLKPVSEPRLAAALGRVGRLASPTPEAGGHVEPADLGVVPVYQRGRVRMVERSSICFVEAAGDYVRLHTDAESHLVRLSLAALETRWADAGFVRIHRQYLVSVTHIRELRSDPAGQTVDVGGHRLPVSRRHGRALRERLVRAPLRGLPG